MLLQQMFKMRCTKGEDFLLFQLNLWQIRLKEISQQIKKDGVSMPDVLRPLTQHSILQCLIGPSHLAFRLEDGRVCRVAYSVRSDRSSTKPDLKRKNTTSQFETSTAARDASRTASGQYGVRPHRSPFSVLSRTSRGISFLREMQRQGIYLARPVASQIPASEVPESLIEECQTVLEGKSRQVIIRELQNTNLDVNMAVNNLLSRDDEAEQSNSVSGDGTSGLGGLGSGSDDWDDESMDLLSFFQYPDSHILFDTDAMVPDELMEPPTSPRHRGELASDYGHVLRIPERERERALFSTSTSEWLKCRDGQLFSWQRGMKAIAGCCRCDSHSSIGTAVIFMCFVIECGFLSDRRKRRRMESQLSSRNNESVTARSGESGRTSGLDSTGFESGCSTPTRQAIQLGDQLEFWSSSDNHELDLQFSQIVALHSELVGLSTAGELHQWRWADTRPFSATANLNPHSNKKTSESTTPIDNWSLPTRVDSNSRQTAQYYHPRVPTLGLLDERIVRLSGWATRATVLTASGKLATWIDESLLRLLPVNTTQPNSVSKLLSFEHRATAFHELRDENIVELHTAPLITVVRCHSGAAYWWGIYPPYLRQRTIEKSRQHRSNVSRSGNTGTKPMRQSAPNRSNTDAVVPVFQTHFRPTSLEVVPGAFVRMKSAPIFHAGAVGFTVVGGVPKVGTLLEDAWRITDVCRFRVNPAQGAPSGIQQLDGVSGQTTSVTTDDPVQHALTCPHALAAASASPYATQSTGGSNAAFATAASPNPSLSEPQTSFHEMPPPPSPASSTCSDQSGPVRVSPGTFKRKKISSTSSDRGDRGASDNESSSRSTRGRSADRELISYVSTSARRQASSVEAGNDLVHKIQLTAVTVEEDWCLSEVIFVEDGRTQPVGIVLKVDGNIAAVRFLKDQERACLASNCPYSPVCSLVHSIINTGSQNHASSTNNSPALPLVSPISTAAFPDPMAWVNDCRLLRKDDLAVVKYADSSRVPEFVQKTPRRLFAYPHIPRSSSDSKSASARTLPPVSTQPKVLTIAPENNRVHVIAEYSIGSGQQQLVYHIYNLSGRLVAHHKLHLPISGIQSSSELSEPIVNLTCPAEPPFLLRDSTGLVYPFIPPNRSGGNQEAVCRNLLLDLPPVQCAAFSWLHLGRHLSSSGRQGSKVQSEQQQSSGCLLGLIVVRDLTLMQHVLRANDSQVERLLSTDCEMSAEVNRRLASELVDGQRNLIHMAVTMCTPLSNRETSPEWNTKLESILAETVVFHPLTDVPTPKGHDPDKHSPVSSNVTLARPTFWSSMARSTNNSGSLSMHELFIRSSIAAAAVAAAASASATTVGNSRNEDREPRPQVANGTNFWHLPPVRKDELTRRVASYRIVRLLLESCQLRPHLLSLLTARNTENLTPFMLAIKYRAYHVAWFLYRTIQSFITSTSESGEFSSAPYKEFLFPYDSHPDDSPLFLLCYNDTCSFTWTGPEHIRQDIFECRTCGLMDSLCCCTECARVCHRGHDCRLKRTSPTAYCDCWEKCRCQSLIAGAQAPRHELFYRLLNDTNLISVINSKNEHLLLFLVKCVERQLREQKQHRPSRRHITSLTSRSSTGATGSATSTAPSVPVTQPSGWDLSGNVQSNPTPEEPEHDLDPPRFVRDALELALDCPKAVESILLMDIHPHYEESCRRTATSTTLDEENILFTQGSAAQLDEFVFTLVCKCPSELVDILLITINRQMTADVSSDGPVVDRLVSMDTECFEFGTHLPGLSPRLFSGQSTGRMRQAAGRFVRAVARIYTGLSLELTADHKKKKSRLLLTQPAPLDVCRHIFSLLAPVTLAELPTIAMGLLTPLRTGTLRPSVTFSLVTQSGDAIQGLEHLFVSERNTSTRRQLLEATDLSRSTDTASLPLGAAEWRNRLVRSVDDRREQSADAHPPLAQSNIPVTYSEHVSLTIPVSHHTVVSTLNVDLSLPAVGSSSAGDISELRDTHSDVPETRPVPTPSPPMSAPIGDPSVLTRQMQSTICDIDKDSYAVDENVMNQTSVTQSTVQIGSFVGDNTMHCTTGPIIEHSYISEIRASELGSSGSTSTNTQNGNFSAVTVDPSLSDSTVNRTNSSYVIQEGRQQGEDSTNVATPMGDLTSASTSQARHFAVTRGADNLDFGTLPKRRRTLDTSVVPSCDDRPQSTTSQQSDDLNVVTEEDGLRISFSLLDGESSASQASSTGATVATTLPDNLDAIDTVSEVTTVSCDSLCHIRSDRNPTVEAFSATTALHPPSQTVQTIGDQPAGHDFGYNEMLTSEVGSYAPSMSLVGSDMPNRVGDEDDDDDRELHGDRSPSGQVTVDFPAEDASDGQVSDYDDEDDDQEEGEDNGDDNEDDDDDEEHETDEEEDVDEDGYGDDGEELIEGEDEEEDDNDDDSSHHSDNSSADAESRSASPTFGSWTRSPVFSRVSSRPAVSRSDEAAFSINTASGTRRASDATAPSSTTLTPLTATSTSVTGSLRTSSSPVRRSVQSVINLLSSTSASSTTTPTIVVSGSSVSNPVTNAMSTSNASAKSDRGCTINTQIHLSRAFGCLMRVIADLIVELREEAGSFNSTIRRCVSVPASIAPPPSVYEQQKQLPVYSSSTSVSSSGSTATTMSTCTNPHTLLLSSPMSTTNLASNTFTTRPFGSSFTEFQPQLFQTNHSVQITLPLLGTSGQPNRLVSTVRPPSFPSRARVSEPDFAELMAAVGVVLSPVWQWLSHALDNLESQLRFSSAWAIRFKRTVNEASDPTSADRQDTGPTAQTSATLSGRSTGSYSVLTIGRSGTNARPTGTLPSSLGGPTGSESVAHADGTVLTQRTDLLSYVFSLMRASGGDHGDSVPSVSASASKHLAYVLDALLYFFKAFGTAWPSGVTRQLLTNAARDKGDTLEMADLPDRETESVGLSGSLSMIHNITQLERGGPGTDEPASCLIGQITQREDSFFRRSESILSLSGFGLDLIDTPLSDSLPLAMQPQRLHPTSTRTELFGPARYFTDDVRIERNISNREHLPMQLNGSFSQWGREVSKGGRRGRFCLEKLSAEDAARLSTNTGLTYRALCVGGGFLDSVGHAATLLSRWCLSLEFFGRHFSSDVGAEHRSYILELGGFTMKEARFRKQMERLRNASRRDLVLEVDREWGSLIMNTVKQLNAEYAKRQSQTSNTPGSTGLGSLTTPPTGIGRYISPSNSAGSLRQQSTSGGSSLAVGLLLGTTTDSPLLGTLFGASPVPAASLSNTNQISQPAFLSSHRVKVSFRDEPGEGSGVARSFFTVFSEAVLSPDTLPPLTPLLQPTTSSSVTSLSSASLSSPSYTSLFHHRHYTNLSRAQAIARSLSITTHAPISSGGNSRFSSSALTTSTSALSLGTEPRATDSAPVVSGGTTVPISFYPYGGQSRLSAGRARTSAWRRAGGLSAQASPFYPEWVTNNSTTGVAESASHPQGRSTGRRVSYSIPSSPTRGTGESECVNVPTETMTIPGLSPGASPSSHHGSQESGPRVLLRSSLLSSSTSRPAAFSSPDSPAASRPTSPLGSTGDYIQTAAENAGFNSVGNRLFVRVLHHTRSEDLAARVTGMLLELPPTEHATLLSNEDALRNRVEEARAVLMMSDATERDQTSHERPRLSSTSSSQPILERLVNWRESSQTGEQTSTFRSTISTVPLGPISTPSSSNNADPERVPLFWQPGLQGYYFPRAVPGTNLQSAATIDPLRLVARYSIYRGIGRVIGLCLLTNETCPLHFNRPVLKYILGRVLRWHDFAFYDSTTFEGLRQLLRSASPDSPESVTDYNLTFSLIPAPEEGGVCKGSDVAAQTQVHNLAPNGEELEVNESNVYEFVKRYTEFKMLESVREPLEQLRQGVFDVLPRNALDGLTAEDLRLLLNGAGDIDTEILASYTTFHDETGSGSTAALGKAIENGSSLSHLDKVARLKRWFWSTVRSMDSKQRQNLLYFWTSSPALPASSQGFQPMPSITIRPADDHHLPSANTCISRLYLPLYSSKHILKEKLLQAIETKSFGFV
ncbi:hypothetical protein T265_02799 [Opisthorchis viverrini]|uniref:E3 ubiquitin-protein ligase UBR5 n=1 Tax=Opisthorchis viverrini TaxID=6198 RepID=A0A074ZTS0_OPIVI|nr:hypothetical protein T265_02799 [Opisthorchis viverrini]KER30873.1 hypothetical protein T265_02799 [Opisthorchis viverrini]